MSRGPLFQGDYCPRLSGHETFTLRYGWLKKAFDAIEKTNGGQESKSVFLNEDSIARFGVGKNMVSSMRHWAESVDILAEDKVESIIHTTRFGQKLFGAKGLDPYMEHPATLWLIHWKLAAYADKKTTWFWAFNHYPDIAFDREHLIRGLERLAKERAWRRASGTTIKNDVACFIRTYVPQQSSRGGHDDVLESPLAELGLIKAIGKHDGFRFVRGPKPSLGNGVFVYALLDFWRRFSPNATTLSFESLVHEPCSPGRAFLLNDNDVIDRLAALGTVTSDAFQWSETANLKQVMRNADLNPETILDCIDTDYPKIKRSAAA